MRSSAFLLVLGATSLFAGDGVPVRDEKAALRPLQDFVGAWKGVGQVERGSNRGAWIERADWRWKFSADGAAIAFAAPESKHLVEGRITPAGDGKFALRAKSAAGSTVDFRGAFDADGALTFVADDARPDEPSRVTIRLRAEGARLVVSLERRAAAGDAFARLAEVGYTRVGSDFGKGSGGPECIVTGGAGTIAVVYKGTTYYVCCTGCKDLFEAEPEKILAEYRARKKLEFGK